MSIESADNILHVKNSTMRISRVEVGQTLSVGNIEFDTTTTLASVTSNGNNTTPHTISSSNVTTGLATTANVVVGGDLIVGGTSLVNAIYPVGTIIDRATAITDTHPNGKYKAFLAAPNQEWQLVDNGDNKVLEMLAQRGNSTSYRGRATMVPATVQQQLTTTWSTATGSEITSFLPVVGTKYIEYEYYVHFSYVSGGNPLAEFRVEFQEGTGAWTEVTDSFHTDYTGIGGAQVQNLQLVRSIFTLGEINDASVGSFAATRPTLGFRVIAREHSSGTQVQLHNAIRHNPGTGTGNVQSFAVPELKVTSFGTDSTLKYERTA
jgi:hypothetical protein